MYKSRNTQKNFSNRTKKNQFYVTMSDLIAFKVCVLGSDCVGKTSFVRAVVGLPFTEERQPLDEDHVCSIL